MRNSKITAIGAASVLAALLLTGGAAASAQPSPEPRINACVGKVGGNVRVIDPARGQRCLGIETPLAWNQNGQPGPTGPAGPAGPAGAVGPAGPAGPGGAGTLGVETVEVSGTVGAGGGLLELRAACPSGTVVTGGGFSKGVVERSTVSISEPYSAGWFVQFVNFGVGPESVSAQAQCLRFG